TIIEKIVRAVAPATEVDFEQKAAQEWMAKVQAGDQNAGTLQDALARARAAQQEDQEHRALGLTGGSIAGISGAGAPPPPGAPGKAGKGSHKDELEGLRQTIIQLNNEGRKYQQELDGMQTHAATLAEQEKLLSAILKAVPKDSQ